MKNKVLTVLIIVCLIIIGISLNVLYELNVIPHRKYTNNDFDIETYVSNIDYDNDGIDDQSDILNNVRGYIATEPEYKSKYYAGGYSDDKYGVCSDVVANGLLGAGYDLRILINEHIKNNGDMYDIEKIDINIDFRRVRNLRVYFEDTAISLTTDVNKIEEWQGGDIVVFEKHIGVVSDKRNKDGVPFLIHHANPYQIYYEEDVLEDRTDIVGHYRIS